MKLSENIKTLRKERNLRQEQLAEAMGVSTASVSKWETGQCAPELTVLMELADYFEVSIDTLMGHSVNSERMDGLIQEMEQAANNRDETIAITICEKLLRNYPNNEKAVQACADCYYKLFIFFDKKSYMEQCIVLTKRLMGLKSGDSECSRLERIHGLGNQYSLLKQWDKAMEYYEKSNVLGVCKSSIAECLLNQKKIEASIATSSDALMHYIFSVYRATNILADGHIAAGTPEKACAALEWLYDLMNGLHCDSTLIVLTQAKIASIHSDDGKKAAAFAALQKAAKAAQNTEKLPDFINMKKPLELLISTPQSPTEILLNMVSKMGADYAEAVQEALR